MEQLIHALDGVKLGMGVKRGLRVKAATGLTVDVEWGTARVGTVEDDASITNKAALGFNQPGRELEHAGTLAVAVPANSTRLVWLKTDNTIVVTADTVDGDYLDVCPELGPDPRRGAIIAALQSGGLRKRPLASLLLARVVTGGAAVTSTDNRIAPRLP